MSEVAIIDVGSKFLKYAHTTNGILGGFEELSIESILKDIQIIKDHFVHKSIKKIILFIPQDYYQAQRITLSSKHLDKGMILEIEKQFQNLKGHYIYSYLPKGSKDLILYNVEAQVSKIQDLKNALHEFQVEVYPNEVAYTVFAKGRLSFLDIGHSCCSIIQVQNDQIINKNDYKFGFANLIELIQQFAKISAAPAFEIALDYLKHPVTLNDKQLEICQQAARKFARDLVEKLDLSMVQNLYLTGGGSFIPELIQKIYQVHGHLQISHLSDVVGAHSSIFNNLHCFHNFYLNKSSFSGYNINEQILRLFKIYNLNI